MLKPGESQAKWDELFTTVIRKIKGESKSRDAQSAWPIISVYQQRKTLTTPSSSLVLLGFQGAERTYSRCPTKANEATEERHDSWVFRVDGEEEGMVVSLAP